MGGIQRFNGVGGYGKSLKDDYRRFYGATVNFAGRGEMIPNDDTYCEIDPDVVDTYGIPVLRFHAKFSRSRNQAGEAHAGDLPRDHPRDGRHAAGADAVARERTTGSRPVGRIIHEVGTTRMGNDPQTSVLNANCQAHDVKNLFVADARPVRLQRAQELHLDDPRARDADRRVHRASSAIRERSDDDDHQSPTRSRSAS